MTVEFLIRERFEVAESPTWDPASGKLFWCDIPAGLIHCIHLESRERQHWSLGAEVASLGLAGTGRLVVALARSIVLFSPGTGDVHHVADIELPAGASRLNDGKVGPDGAFYVGSMDRSSTPRGALYRIDASGRVDILTSGFSTSNGLAWTHDGRTMFHSDSQGEMFIDRWDFDPASGRPANRRRLREHDLANGRADGGAFDMSDVYWSAAPSCSRVNRIDLEGNLMGWVDLPIAKPTMPCFGGPDLRTIFVTSLASGRQEEGHDGIVQFRVDTPGVPAHVFGATR